MPAHYIKPSPDSQTWLKSIEEYMPAWAFWRRSMLDGKGRETSVHKLWTPPICCTWWLKGWLHCFRTVLEHKNQQWPEMEASHASGFWKAIRWTPDTAHSATVEDELRTGKPWRCINKNSDKVHEVMHLKGPSSTTEPPNDKRQESQADSERATENQSKVQEWARKIFQYIKHQKAMHINKYNEQFLYFSYNSHIKGRHARRELGYS
jgi:hypothetical protein